MAFWRNGPLDINYLQVAFLGGNRDKELLFVYLFVKSKTCFTKYFVIEVVAIFP